MLFFNVFTSFAMEKCFPSPPFFTSCKVLKGEAEGLKKSFSCCASLCYVKKGFSVKRGQLTAGEEYTLIRICRDQVMDGLI